MGEVALDYLGILNTFWVKVPFLFVRRGNFFYTAGEAICLASIYKHFHTKGWIQLLSQPQPQQHNINTVVGYTPTPPTTET